MVTPMLNNPDGWTVLAALLGLLVGSFINVVVWRLPRMIKRDWQTQAAAILGQSHPSHAPLSLMQPGSHCPTCATPLRWQDLLPLLSFAWLRGRCAHGGCAISWRYPMVELAVAAFWGVSVARFGIGLEALAWAGFATVLLALSLIDLDTMLLPDVLTQPLLWTGLLASALGLTGVQLTDSVWGAAAGYGVLWLVQALFGLVTGKQGMGEGDFKLLAALGAWLGWLALPMLVLLSSLLGVFVALVMRWRGQLKPGQALPFGPYLALSGVITAAFAPMLVFNHRYIF
jgi:leader peptidase (prepilin peptidase) / N-methyltransferase